MTTIDHLRHEFVENIPETVDEGVLYISMRYTTAIHKCCCGCGLEVPTPFDPACWQMSFDGRHVSIRPSIGNYGFSCQSHYWIRRNKVEWAKQMSRTEIEKGRLLNHIAKEKQYRYNSMSPLSFYLISGLKILFFYVKRTFTR